MKEGLYACPTCGKSMQDMTSVWDKVDREVAETPMPAEYAGLYRKILCKDCNKHCYAEFHIVGMKCKELVLMIRLSLATWRMGLRMAGRQMMRWLTRWLKRIWTETRRLVYFNLGIER